MYCSLSGEVPSEPVVSKASGHLFEKRLILKQLELTGGVCPITGDALDANGLLELKGADGRPPVAARPRPLAAASVPGLMALLQNEWDDLMLETHTLRQHLDGTRKELSQLLYQHDAACRVIARLVGQRDEARALLAPGQQAAAQGAAAAMDVEPPKPPPAGAAAPAPAAAAAAAPASGIADAAVAAMSVAWKALSKGRKKRPIPAGLAEAGALGAYAVQASATVHKARPAGGVTCAAGVRSDKPNLVLTGGADGAVHVVDRDEGGGASIASLAGHGAAVTDAAWTAEYTLTASADGSAHLHVGDTGVAGKPAAAKKGKGKRKGSADASEPRAADATFRDHGDGAVAACAVHPACPYAATAGADGSWCFYDLEQKALLHKHEADEADGGGEGGLTALRFHPDGLIFATGAANGAVRMWDVKSQGVAASFDGHTGPVTSMTFSQNGYHMATGSDDGTVRVWDLRKLKQIKLLGEEGGAPVAAVAFDRYGQYLAYAAGADVHVTQLKTWDSLATLSGGHKKPVTACEWGPDAKFLLSAGADRALATWAGPADAMEE